MSGANKRPSQPTPEHGHDNEVDELDSLLDQYDAEAKAQLQQVKKGSGKRGRAGALPGMVRGREEGLARPLDKSNLGFKLLQKMGENGCGVLKFTSCRVPCTLKISSVPIISQCQS